MKIIVDHTSMQPIYEQIVEQIKKQILQGTLREADRNGAWQGQLCARGESVTACGRTEKRDRAVDGTAGGEGAGVWHERRRTAGGSGIVFGSIGVQSQEWRII